MNITGKIESIEELYGKTQIIVDINKIVAEIIEEAESNINKTKDTAINEFNQNASDYERKHRIYRIILTEEIPKMTEYTLPCNYTVGNDSLEIFYNNERLIKEIAEDMEANYREIGESGAISNKIVFGWNLAIGSILDILVKGEHADETN